MVVDEESIDANENEQDVEEEEERGGGGGLGKRRRSEEEKDEEEEKEEEYKLVTKLDLPPGGQEHQQLKDHTICFANHTYRMVVFETTDYG